MIRLQTSDCPRCLKPIELCVCEFIRPTQTKTHILILQHPQEPDKALGTARIAHLTLPNSTLKTGLSWPNLRAALGPGREGMLPSHWGVLYLGSGLKERVSGETGPSIQFVTQQGATLPPPLIPRSLEGVVLLDGTWSQAKALWWRNPWLLKLKRAILVPARRSLYRELRREPRRECLSTLESIAETLLALGETPEASQNLKMVFENLLEKYRKRSALKKA